MKCECESRPICLRNGCVNMFNLSKCTRNGQADKLKTQAISIVCICIVASHELIHTHTHTPEIHLAIVWSFYRDFHLTDTVLCTERTSAAKQIQIIPSQPHTHKHKPDRTNAHAIISQLILANYRSDCVCTAIATALRFSAKINQIDFGCLDSRDCGVSWPSCTL